jgi:hypothetical protein
VTLSAQFLTLYSVALIVVSVVSTLFFVQSHTMQTRALKRYAAHMATLNQRWRTLGAESDGQGHEPEAAPAADSSEPDSLDSPDPFDRAPKSKTADIIIRALVAALTPDSLAQVASRKPANDGVGPAKPARATATVPIARTELNPVGPQELSEAKPTPTVAHAPVLQPAEQDFVELVDLDCINPDYVSPSAEGSEPNEPAADGQRYDTGHRWNSPYRGRHEAELLIYPTAPFPLVVRNERDGGSRR